MQAYTHRSTHKTQWVTVCFYFVRMVFLFIGLPFKIRSVHINWQRVILLWKKIGQSSKIKRSIKKYKWFGFKRIYVTVESSFKAEHEQMNLLMQKLSLFCFFLSYSSYKRVLKHSDDTEKSIFLKAVVHTSVSGTTCTHDGSDSTGTFCPALFSILWPSKTEKTTTNNTVDCFSKQHQYLPLQ